MARRGKATYARLLGVAANTPEAAIAHTLARRDKEAFAVSYGTTPSRRRGGLPQTRAQDRSGCGSSTRALPRKTGCFSSA